MPDQYKLRCRLDVCDNIEVFDSTIEANASEWTEISTMGMMKPDYMVHPAYCPAHSMDLEDE